MYFDQEKNKIKEGKLKSFFQEGDPFLGFFHTIREAMERDPHLKQTILETIAPFQAAAPMQSEPGFISIAREELGVHEISGDASNKEIEKYHNSTGRIDWNDDVPWCGSFMNWVMKMAGYKTVPHPYRALSWMDFGKSAHHPVMGAIAVKRRKGGGHVTFVVGISADGNWLKCLGGNQNDSVTIASYRTEVFEDFRVPWDYDAERYALAAYDSIEEQQTMEV